MDATAHYVVQVHYNNARGLVGQTDRSGVSLCTTNKIRPNDADVLAFGSVNFSVPPMSTKDITCNLQVPTGLPDIHLVAAYPHMHEYGTTISTTSNGVDLGTVANWNFNNQPWFPVDHVVKAGDTVNFEADLMARYAERLLGQMDLVQRDAFEAVKAMAAKAREENAALTARVERLEAALQPTMEPRS